MNSKNPKEKNDAVVEELVAYLDGELSADDSRSLEERLANDAQYRKQLQQIEQAWGMLDLLPAAKVNETFTQTTIEMIAVSAEDDLHQTQIVQTNSRQRFYLYGAATVIAACIAGFMLTAKFISNKNDQLLQDLPLVENSEMYQQIDDLTDLEKMVSADLFLPEVDDEP